jgi:Universal stress protein family
MSDLRLLIATGDSASDIEALPAGVRAIVDAAGEIMVVAPALPTRLQWLASDTDKTREAADKRLQEVVEQIDESGADVQGVVGADDPVLAIEEATEEFEPDLILIALRPAAKSGWQERGLVDQVVSRASVPVAAFKLG